MLLLIDAGNTLVKWALAPVGLHIGQTPPAWLHQDESAHDTLDNLHVLWRTICPGQQVKRVLISNVAGPVIHERILNQVQQLVPAPVAIECFTSTRFLGGVTNNYTDPAQLGCDRFASLIGARALFPVENLVIVTCGTATTIDTLTANGNFIGGMILPGLRLMANALVGNTALLPDIGRIAEKIPPFATDTVNAIRNGCMTAQAGAIEHAVAVHARHLSNIRCILSGGAAKLVLPYLSIPAQIVDNLALVGLLATDTEKHASDPLC